MHSCYTNEQTELVYIDVYIDNVTTYTGHPAMSLACSWDHDRRYMKCGNTTQTF